MVFTETLSLEPCIKCRHIDELTAEIHFDPAQISTNFELYKDTLEDIHSSRTSGAVVFNTFNLSEGLIIIRLNLVRRTGVLTVDSVINDIVDLLKTVHRGRTKKTKTDAE